MRRREFLQAAVLAVPVLLGAPPRRAPLALATADTEDFVAIVGLAGGRRRPATRSAPTTSSRRPSGCSRRR